MHAGHIQTMFAYYQMNLQVASETVCLLFNISRGSFFHMIIWYESALDAREIYGSERNKDEFSYSSTLTRPPGSAWRLWLVSFWASCSHEKSPGWALLLSGLRGRLKEGRGGDHVGSWRTHHSTETSLPMSKHCYKWQSWPDNQPLNGS